MEFDLTQLEDLKTFGNQELIDDCFKLFEKALKNGEEVLFTRTDQTTLKKIPFKTVDSIKSLLTFKIHFLGVD